MWETRDLGTRWPQWQTLIFEGEARIDMRCACPKDVKKMLVQQARSVHWKKWAAKTRVRRIEGGFLAGAGSGFAAEEIEGRVD